ncbi:hypothetical protein ES319_D07G168700v1 [Gossypium barbadense]|uniref:Uncharacterized protein n=2 Tax=Gossypium TaxID=3633 RepID=A0A5J5QSE9_GOSBA|nr:hypothetical protein ES319_D07G168700v1 [Gossypium barbadense]TYG61829.1 hypothetical protein ES288_D07G180400v1 [Gossypium darwinii]
MRQCLKFLKIDMQLNNDKLSKPCAASSQSFIPLRSPSFQPPSEGFNTVAADSSMQLVVSFGCPCTTIDVSNLDPLRDGGLRVVIPKSTNVDSTLKVNKESIYLCNSLDTRQALKVLKLERNSLEHLLQHYYRDSATKEYLVNSLTIPQKSKEAIGGITKLTHSDGRSLVINVEYN